MSITSNGNSPSSNGNSVGNEHGAMQYYQAGATAAAAPYGYYYDMAQGKLEKATWIATAEVYKDGGEQPLLAP
jgi:hypothetical protein